MKRNELIKELFIKMDETEDCISKQTHDKIDRFTAKYAPEGYMPADNFMSDFWMIICQIQLQAFTAGFNIAMELRNTDIKRALNEHAATQTI